MSVLPISAVARACRLAAIAVGMTGLTWASAQAAAPAEVIARQQARLAQAKAEVAKAEKASGQTQVLITVKPGANGHGRNAVATAGGTLVDDLARWDLIVAKVPTQALAGLARNPHVVSVEADPVRVTMAESTTPSTGTPYQLGQQVPWGIQAVQADQLSDAATGNRTVCIIDTGYDGAHEDLPHGVTVRGEDVAGVRWDVDYRGHGTHVAGTIAALNNNKGVVGVNSSGRLNLFIVNVFGQAPTTARASSVLSAANKCVENGAHIISMSLGGDVTTNAEQNVFAKIERGGVLAIAAAGNDGNAAMSYPASLPGVMSVAAVDASGARAPFSQYNAQVEIAGPGVGIWSTVPMGFGTIVSLNVGGTPFEADLMSGSPRTGVTAPLADFGLGTTVDTAMAGKVCLITRGQITFGQKVANCQASGGVGAIVANNVPGAFSGTLGDLKTTIPSVSVAGEDLAPLKARIGQSATIGMTFTNYDVKDGTSMATPHVAGVAALVWSRHTQCTAAQIRASLNRSAKDLDAPGRDVYTGYGLVQAKAADERIRTLGCGQ